MMINSVLPRTEVNRNDALTELARFFTITSKRAQMCPMFSGYIDRTWHTLISSPDSYAHFSLDSCGQVLGHQESQGYGRIPWVSDYEARFGKLPPLWFADATGNVDQIAYAAYSATGEVFHSWDCTATTNDDDDDD